jgi:hypothetical protein
VSVFVGLKIKKMYVILLILFFINVANDIGKGIIFDENNHPSIDRIRKNAPKNNCMPEVICLVTSYTPL